MLVYMQMIDSDEEKMKFENIYLAYSEMMYNLAFSKLTSVEKAEDVVHDVFIKIAENIKSIEPVCAKTRLLAVTMVKNRIIDTRRAKSEECEISENELLRNISVEDSSEPLISECIYKLPQKQRQLIWLKFFHGYKNHEIAQMLDVSVAWIQKNEQRAKRKLAELYKEEGGEL